MVGDEIMQIVWKGQGGGGRRCVRLKWRGGAYKTEPCARDSEGVEEASASDSAALSEEAAWATDMSWLMCSGHWGRRRMAGSFFGNVSLLEGCMSGW